MPPTDKSVGGLHLSIHLFYLCEYTKIHHAFKRGVFFYISDGLFLFVEEQKKQ